MGAIVVIISGVLGAAIGIAILVGVSLGIVYGLMWLLTDLLSLPYVAASSTLFATLTVFVIIGGIGQILKAENKGLGFLTAVFSILLSPLTYAASFRAHAAWTHADLSGGGRYLPGEYWQYVSAGAGWASKQISTVVPAFDGVVSGIEHSQLMTQIVSSVVSGAVLLIGQQMFRKKPQPAQI